ncbi:MAG: hypothetical protein RLZZ200_1106 [Pseudomonadota bacterium]|jgi:hypothetical protein
MSNSFSKEERVAFEQLIEGFDDALVLSRNVAKYQTNPTEMERTGDVIWRPQPYIAQTFDGMDQTTNFQNMTQLSVPATLGFSKAAPWILDAKELRDALQEGRLGDAAKQKLATDINVAIMNVAANQGTLFVKRAAAATGFDDVAAAEAIFNEQGVPMNERCLALSTRDYNGMASNLAGRQTVAGKVLTAYEKAYVGLIASFDTYKLDYANRQAAAAGGAGLQINTLVAGAQFYVPRATSVAVTGEKSNVDNRFQRVTISSTTNVAAGDAFVIGGVNAVHHITKGDTGQQKTFRVISVDSATTMTISPPIISAQGGTDAELQYKNCVVNTPSATAAITFLNTVAASVNPFWQRDALEILPGRYAVPTDAGTAVMRATTDQGIEVVMQKFYDINTMKTKFRLDTLFGVVNKQPEMTGLIMFSQT